MSNSGPLIHLSKAGALNLLLGLYRPIITEEVREEVVERGKERGHPDALVVEEAIARGEIEVRTARVDPEFARLGRIAGLHEAEISVVHLARAEGLPVLLDEDCARIFARALGLEVKGSVGVVLEAARAGLIPRGEGRRILERLSEVMYLSSDVLLLALRELEKL